MSITKPGYCAEESEKLKKDIRLSASVAKSFSNAGHTLTKVELSYGVWLNPWFRMGIYVDPYWQDFSDEITHAIEWGLDTRFLFLRGEDWCLGFDISGGLLHSNDDFP